MAIKSCPIEDSKINNILIINPNSSKDMTENMKRMVNQRFRDQKKMQIYTYTAPTGPDSINNENDAAISADVVFEDLQDRNKKLLESNNSFIVACYSVHPLSQKLKTIMPKERSSSVIGIFEASILISVELLLAPRDEARPRLGQFGVVTTGKYWEEILADGAQEIMKCKNIPSHFFNGVVSTGLSALELHTTPPEEVRLRMMVATKKLLDNESVQVICLGCAGMAGMDVIVREACIEKRGSRAGKEIFIVDGIHAAISVLSGEFQRGKTGNVVDSSGRYLVALEIYRGSL